MQSNEEREWRNAVREATRLYAALGLIPRYSICQHCNRRPSVHLHHRSYGRLDDVEWLCLRCHVDHHKEERAHARTTDEASCQASGHAPDAG